MDSPFTHLLSSGSPPTADEVPAIRHFIADVHTHVASLDEQIAATEATLAKLKSDKEATVALGVTHEALLSPHSYYPVEIICEIFRLAVQITGDPWVLSQICRRWRRIALEFPFIWSSININLSPRAPLFKSPARSLDTLAKTTALLVRSAGAPLTLVFRAPRTMTEGVLRDYVSDLFAMLVAHAERWENVHLVVYPEHYPYLAPLRGRLSSLKTLVLGGMHEPESQLTPFHVAPKLRNLTLIGYMLHIPTVIRLPWDQITNYSADLDYNHEHLEALSLLTGVVEARLTLSNLVFTTHEPPRRVLTMERLYLNRGSLLDLDLPALRELTYEPLDRESVDEVPLENLLTFLVRSSPPLTKLCLIGRDFSDALLVSVLQQTPVLVDLCIQCRHLKNPDMVYLTDVVDFLDVGDGVHLAGLLTLTFGGYDFADYDKLANMVESRWRKAPQRLNSFGLITRHSPDLSQAHARLETLRDEGLQVLLVDGEGATEAFFSLPFFEIDYARDNDQWSRWTWTH
ncbi:hypothetical protein DFH06DRAFT_1044408 [Mycena polygramma]|nr:hypothetical protein DFH06DRAFT_1044408 [Mycena polygramma]